ncbi:MAG: DUF2791 family P-loop domain-containing protein [Planctomycetota bacterium]
MTARLVLERFLVSFDNAPHLPRTMTESELAPEQAALAQEASANTPAAVSRARPAKPSAVKPTATSTAPVPTHESLDREEAWQTLEALRLGVVPARGVREYTVARDMELASVDQMLRDGQGCRVVWGDYGAGKTHLLEAAEQLALERNYAVARVTLDPTEHGLQHPLRLYRAIAERVRSLQHAQPGIEHILDRLVDSSAHNSVDGASFSRFLSPYTFMARHGEALLTEKFTGYVRGEGVPIEVLNQCLTILGWRGPRLLAMPDYRTYGRMYVHIIGTLAAWCKDAGLAGLALFFDEFERVDALPSQERLLALEVFRHYAAVLMTPTDLVFDPESLYRGGHDVHRALPLRFKRDLPLVGMFALTPLGDIEASYRKTTLSNQYDLRLAPLARRDVLTLVPRIASLYQRAYPDYELAPDTLARVRELVERALSGGDDSFRAAVRAIVFSLDAARLGRLSR